MGEEKMIETEPSLLDSMYDSAVVEVEKKFEQDILYGGELLSKTLRLHKCTCRCRGECGLYAHTSAVMRFLGTFTLPSSL